MDTAIKNMSVEEKIILVEELWEDIEKERKNGLTDRQLELLEIRRINHLKNPTSGISLQQFIEKYS